MTEELTTKTVTQFAKENHLSRQGVYYLIDKKDLKASDASGQILIDSENVVTKAEAARQLNVTARTIVIWLEKGYLTSKGNFVLKDEKFKEKRNES